MCAFINKVSPQCIPLFLHESFKLNILILVFVSFTWAENPTAIQLSGDLNCQTLKIVLFHRINLKNESDQSNDRTEDQPNLTLFDQYANLPPKRFGNQKNYHYNRVNNQNRNNKRFNHQKNGRNKFYNGNQPFTSTHIHQTIQLLH